MICDVQDCVHHKTGMGGCFDYCGRDETPPSIKFVGEFDEDGLPIFVCKYYLKKMYDKWYNKVLDELGKGEVRTIQFLE